MPRSEYNSAVLSVEPGGREASVAGTGEDATARTPAVPTSITANPERGVANLIGFMARGYDGRGIPASGSEACAFITQFWLIEQTIVASCPIPHETTTPGLLA